MDTHTHIHTHRTTTVTLAAHAGRGLIMANVVQPYYDHTTRAAYIVRRKYDLITPAVAADSAAIVVAEARVPH